MRKNQQLFYSVVNIVFVLTLLINLTNPGLTMTLKKQDIEFGELLNHTGYHIRRAHTTFMRQFSSFGKDFSLKSQQSSILVLTRENPGITPATLADAIEIERSLMAKLLTDLTQRGFIETKASTSDGRQKGLYITPKGNKFIRKVMDNFWDNLEPNLTKNLSEKERSTLTNLLKKIYIV